MCNNVNKLEVNSQPNELTNISILVSRCIILCTIQGSNISQQKINYVYLEINKVNLEIENSLKAYIQS